VSAITRLSPLESVYNHCRFRIPSITRTKDRGCPMTLACETVRANHNTHAGQDTSKTSLQGGRRDSHGRLRALSRSHNPVRQLQYGSRRWVSF